eukprot:3770779-Pyramimonas_sp.AAC.1
MTSAPSGSSSSAAGSSLRTGPRSSWPTPSRRSRTAPWAQAPCRLPGHRHAAWATRPWSAGYWPPARAPRSYRYQQRPPSRTPSRPSTPTRES